MYSRKIKSRKRKIVLVSTSIVTSLILVVSFILVVLYQQATPSLTKKAEADVIEKTVLSSSSELSTTSNISSSSSSIDVASESDEQNVDISVVQQAEDEQVSDTTLTVTPTNINSVSYIASNGNTAGSIGTAAAAQMAAATGVSQATWEAIIARESNGDPNVSNSSGASGLFQTMPGWGSTATVQDQINSAINAYNAQGLSAWGY